MIRTERNNSSEGVKAGASAADDEGQIFPTEASDTNPFHLFVLKIRTDVRWVLSARVG